MEYSGVPREQLGPSGAEIAAIGVNMANENNDRIAIRDNLFNMLIVPSRVLVCANIQAGIACPCGNLCLWQKAHIAGLYYLHPLAQ